MFLIGILVIGTIIFGAIYASEVYGNKFSLRGSDERIDDDHI